MPEKTEIPLSGRRAQAARNDDRILQAAREVFVENPSAPIAAVAQRAEVGISALYRRYPSKEELLRRLCADGLERYIAESEAALADDGDQWEAFAAWMRRVVEADTHSLTLRLAGTFEPTEELWIESTRAQEVSDAVLERAQKAGVVRADLTPNDLAFVFEQLAAISLGGAERTVELRRRYLALQLDGLRARPGAGHGRRAAGDSNSEPLPGPPPADEELGRRWIYNP
jgi:AcrR family transcriptional regulator